MTKLEQSEKHRGRRFLRVRLPLWARVLLIAVAATVVLVSALFLGGGAASVAAEGLQDPGPITGWGLPISKLGMDLVAAATVGSLLFGVLAPAKRGVLDRTAARAIRTASLLAWIWVLMTALTLVFTLSDFAGTPPESTDYPGLMSLFIAQTPQGRSLAVVFLLAVVVAATARGVETLNGAALVLIIGIAAVIPPALSGHSASAANHDLATSSLLVHIVAISLWVGGLFALALYGRWSTHVLKVAARRFSSVALWCFGAAALSGLLNAYLNLGSVPALWETRYGWLVFGKAIALGVLGYLGYNHRERTLPKLDRDEPGAFRKFALGEVVVMACTVGLAVALSRTPRPVPQTRDVGSVAEGIIGYPILQISLGRLATLWRPDSLVLLLAVTATITYVFAVRKIKRRGIPWPAGRTTAWLAGVAVGVFVLTSGIATYAPALFSVHMVQHMTLTMLVPILLAMGAPITLALRALPAQPAVEGDRTAREWILVILHSRVMRVLTHPVVALTLYIVTLYAFYFSPLFAWAMSSHLTHLLMIAHFLLVGSLYFWPIIGLDPMPRKLPPAGRMGLMFASMPFHAFFGVIVMMSTTVIGASWYTALKLPWVDLRADQNFGGGFAWTMAELPSLAVLVVVFIAWYRTEQRAGIRADRNGEAEWEAYNAQLARIADRDRG